MSLPNMASTVLSFSQTIIKRTTTQTVIDFEPVDSFVDTPFLATITTPTSEDLAQAETDTKLRYKNIHSIESIVMDDLFVHRSIEYKIIKLNELEDYGYFSGLGEEVQ